MELPEDRIKLFTNSQVTRQAAVGRHSGTNWQKQTYRQIHTGRLTKPPAQAQAQTQAPDLRAIYMQNHTKVGMYQK